MKGASLWIGRVFEFRMFFGEWERLSVFLEVYFSL